MPTALGIWGLGKVKVESLPLVVGAIVEPMAVPPVQVVAGAIAWQSVQLTVPPGGPPTELPTTVAVSPQMLPTAVSSGATIVVVRPGVAALTATHWRELGVPEMLSLEPV